jgi:long-chain acyl-CoA synthetase
MTDSSSPVTDAGGSERLLSRRIRQVLALDPHATALTFEGATFPWGFYSAAVTDLDALLADRPGLHRVGIVLRNRPGPLAALVATIGTGRELVTLSPHLGEIGLAQDVADLAPDVIVADDVDWARGGLLHAAERIRAVALRTGPGRALAPRPVSWTPDPAIRPPRDVAVLMMTSGTTGRPKRVELTYDRMVASFRAAGLPLTERQEPHLRSTTAILWAPLAHISGLYFALMHVLEGRSIAMLEKFDVDAWVELVRRHRPRFVRLAPTALRMILQAGVPAEVFEGIHAVGSGTAPLPAELAEEFEQRYRVPVLGTYGATEFAGAIAGWTLKDKKEWGEQKRGSVGRAHDGIELRIVDYDGGEVLAPSEIGLLEARGGQLPGDPGAWLRTTDLALIDDDGFLYIHGRADEAINRGGFKIPPSVIEDALRQHPAVDEISVIGLPDHRLGEVPAVAVTLTGPATEEELMEHLASRLTRYQLPVALRVVDALPRTPSMKVSQPLVREQYFSDPR